jgi:hypothetical protein
MRCDKQAEVSSPRTENDIVAVSSPGKRSQGINNLVTETALKPAPKLKLSPDREACLIMAQALNIHW